VNVLRIARTDRLRGTIAVPGDKSIAHRALILGAMARGWTRIVGLPDSADVSATSKALGECGVHMQRNGDAVIVQGRGHGALEARGVIDCRNSGTTMRLMTGVLAGTSSRVSLVGDASLSRRPMRRVADPLRAMDATIELAAGGTAPIAIVGRQLQGAAITLTVPSAQVKSAVLLAGLHARGTTVLGGALTSRDHTERMLPLFGGRLERRDGELVVPGEQELHGAFVRVPGDPSSAAFWIGAALLVPDGDIVIRNVGANPTRLGFVELLRRMGADITIELERKVPEPIATLRARSSALHAVNVSAEDVAASIDELPLLAVVATQAKGTTTVHGARELRVKESDRIESVAALLRSLGARVETYDDGFAVSGPVELRGAPIVSNGDHRIAMAASVAALIAEGECALRDSACADVSYPSFYSTLASLGGNVA
jgi:3-phosphoshikimate 1-carboxyvinyltransferase